MRKYKTWWLVVWAMAAVGLLGSLWFLPFWRWAAIAAMVFGVLEYIGVKNESGSGDYPPLTQVIVHYIPSVYAFMTIYGLLAAAMCSWLHVETWSLVTISLGAALGGWFSEHFREAYAKAGKDAA